MSVYIKVREAELKEQPTYEQLAINILAEDSFLQTGSVPASTHPNWSSSFIASIKQKKLAFEVVGRNAHDQGETLGRCQLFFSSFRGTPDREVSQNITMEGFGKLTLDIYYTERKRFLGPIEFYEYGNFEPEIYSHHDISKSARTAADTVLHSSPYQRPAVILRTEETEQSLPTKQTPKKKGFFTCCGEDFDDKMYTVEEEDVRGAPTPIPAPVSSGFTRQLVQPKEGQVQFVKGACSSKNLFSICDAGVQNQKFTVVQDYYRDK